MATPVQMLYPADDVLTGKQVIDTPAQEGPRKVQANSLSMPRDQDGILVLLEGVLVHGLRNSARVWMFSLKQPPRAVVLVWEFVSITPRDLTQ